MDRPSKETRLVSQVAILLLLPLISAAVAFCIVTGLLWRADVGFALWRSAWNAALVAAVSAVLVGAPAAHWAATSGRRRIDQWIGLGAAAGALLLVVPLGGHVIGAVARGETDVLNLTWGVMLRMILDMLGLSDLYRIRRGLLLIETLPVITGALSGAIFWQLVVRRKQ
jgi:hypothetical protein